VIAISAYTEPIPVTPSTVEPQVHENEESEYNSSFCELLASLTQGGQPVNQSGEIDLNVLPDEMLLDVNRLDVFANVPQDNIDFDSSDIDLSDSAIDKVYQNILNADPLLLSIQDDFIEFDEETLSILTELMSSKNELSLKDISAVTEKLDSDSVSRLLSALDQKTKQGLEEAGLDTSDKNKRVVKEQSLNEVSLKDEKIETLYRNKPDNENSSFSNSRDEGKNRLDEFRRSRRDKVSFEVRDMRTAQNISTALADTSRVSGQAGAQELTLNLRIPEYDKSIMQAQTTWDAKANVSAGSALENLLAREFANFNGDIVRHASIALKDGGIGTIKIALHPQTLGNVKIHLELTDNKITGRIVVDSQEALNAFRKEITSLEQAFKESGFADASLNLSLSAEQSGAEKQEFNEESFNRRIAASNYDDSYDSESVSVVDVIFGQKSGLVNIFA